MAFILDTSFIISFLEGEDDAVAKLSEMRRTRANLQLPAPAYFEIMYGYEVVADEAEYELFREAARDIAIPAFDRSRAAMASRLRARLRTMGRETGAVDSMVLSFVSSGSDILVTRDGPLEDAACSLGIRVDPHPAGAET